jgi:hypothetical protein
VRTKEAIMKEIFCLGEYWEEEYGTAECIVYRSKDGRKRLYKYWDGSKEVCPVKDMALVSGFNGRDDESKRNQTPG